MQIRPVTINDCDALGLIIVTASLATFLGQIPEKDLDFSWTPEVSACNWRDLFEEHSLSEEIFYVAEKGVQVIGFVRAKVGAACKGLEWSVHGLYVLPSEQKRGVGCALLS